MTKEELEKEKCELLGIIQGKDKVIKDLEWQIKQILEDNESYQKENAELKTKVTALKNANRAMVKELDDTTSGGLNILQNVVKNKEQLTKTKKIIKRLLKATYGEGWNYSLDVKVKAEDFLKECK